MDIESEYSSKHTRRVKKTQKKIVGDSVSVVKSKNQKQQQIADWQYVIQNRQNNTQTLLLKGKRTEFFVTQDSHRYITQQQLDKISQNYNYVDPRGYFDSIHFRYVKQYTASELQYKYIVSEFRSAKNIAMSFREALRLDLSPIRMWQVSLAGAVLFGMVSMSMIYKNLGQNAFAKEMAGAIGTAGDKAIEQMVVVTDSNEQEEGDVGELSDKDGVKKQEEEKDGDADKQEEGEVEEVVSKTVQEEVDQKPSVDSVQEKVTKQEKQVEKEVEDKEIKPVDSVVKKQQDEAEDQEKNEEKTEYSLEESAYDLVEGYPIEKMLPYILEQDPEVAKYLIAIAKQESAWGKRVPVLNGQDCYNYWGYRSKRKLMGSGGHTCFNSRKDAVETVGKRIHELIYEYDRSTADRLVVWKCGSSCAGHAPEGVQRWIGVVDTYYDKLSGSSS